MNLAKSDNMPQKIVPLSTPSSPLSIDQHKAIAMLLSGKTITETAQLLNKNRDTVSRWKKHPVFIAEINRIQNDMQQAYQHKLTSMAAQAVSVVESKLAEGNLRAALHVLTMVTPNATSLETDPHKILCREAETIALQQLGNGIKQLSTSEAYRNKFFWGLYGDIQTALEKKYDVCNDALFELADLASKENV